MVAVKGNYPSSAIYIIYIIDIMGKQRIELTYLGESYSMQLSNEEYIALNRGLLTNHGKQDVVAIALESLMKDNVCTKHHKGKITEILGKTRKLNFRLL